MRYGVGVSDVSNRVTFEATNCCASCFAHANCCTSNIRCRLIYGIVVCVSLVAFYRGGHGYSISK